MFEMNTKKNTLIIVSSQALYETLSEHYEDNEIVAVTTVEKSIFDEIALGNKIKNATLNCFILDINNDEAVGIYSKINSLCDKLKTILFPVVIKKDNIKNDFIEGNINLKHSILVLKESEITKSLDLLINSLNGSYIPVAKESLYGLEKEGVIVATFGEGYEPNSVKCATEMAVGELKAISKKEPNDMIFFCEEKTHGFINLQNIYEATEVLSNEFSHENLIVAVNTNPKLNTEIRVSLLSHID